MDEEKYEEDMNLGEREADSHLKTKKKKNFLIIYGFTLMLAAFVLILLSYMGQVRAAKNELAEAQEEHTSFSTGALKSIDQLKEENARYSVENAELLEKNDILAEGNATLINDLADKTDEAADLDLKLSAAEKELALCRKINALTAALGSEEKAELIGAAEIVAEMEQNGEAEHLHASAVSGSFATGTDMTSALYINQKYDEICGELEALGYLTEKDGKYILETN